LPEEMRHHKADFSSRLDRNVAVLWRAPVLGKTSGQVFLGPGGSPPPHPPQVLSVSGRARVLHHAAAAPPGHLWPQDWRCSASWRRSGIAGSCSPVAASPSSGKIAM